MLPSERHDKLRIGIYQSVLAVGLLILWEIAGRGAASAFISRPTAILEWIGEWARHGLGIDIAYTLMEMAAGLAIGATLGVGLGLLLGATPWLEKAFRPIIIAFYSIPLLAISPLLIMLFGLGMMPKIVLVIFVVSFIMMFSTLSGAHRIDGDLIASTRLMGASKGEQFWKVMLPGASAWIVSGLKVALPNALVAAVTGEMLSVQKGLGSVLGRAGAEFDMTGVYAALVLLMAAGMLVSALADRVERVLLRWRHAAR